MGLLSFPVYAIIEAEKGSSSEELDLRGKVLFGVIAMGFAFGLKEISVDDNEHSQYSISQKLKEVITESINFLVTNKKARAIMFLNALIGAVSTLVGSIM